MVENLQKNRTFLLFSLIFLTLMLINYAINRSFVKNALINEQLLMLKNSSDKVQKWLESKKSSLSAVSELILNISPKDDEILIKDILRKSENIAGFRSVYVGYESGSIISSKDFKRPENYLPKERPWYENTIKNGGFYITKPYVDKGLKILVISICKSVKNGVLCGILSFDDVKNELENNNLFLSDDSSLNTQNPLETDDEILSFKRLENSHLILIAKTPKKDIYAKINEQFIINFAIYLLSIILFLILAYFYNKKISKQKAEFEMVKQEYEILLFSSSKMAELGAMIAAISHQWIQPLNSLSIFLGNLVQFKKLGRLSDEIFYENTKRSLENIDYMANVMQMFKEFYKSKNEPEIFNVKQAILDTIFILFAKNYDLKIKICLKKDTQINCLNYINEFKQIIACLISNSKDALREKKHAIIVININERDEKMIIDVIDNGSGIKDKTKIFKPFFSAKNSSGLGLYISKLIANKKLNGDLRLKNSQNPTIFTLEFLKDVRH